MAYKGIFRCRHPEKYKGNPNNIVWRSTWEHKVMRYLDSHPEIKKWSSEEVIIQYANPMTGKFHRYFPDFWVQKTNGEELLIEVKPKAQTIPPNPSKYKGKVSKKFLKEASTYAINRAKWEAAIKTCNSKNWKFVILTESEINTI